MAGQLFAQALPAVNDFTSPRAWAFGLVGHSRVPAPDERRPPGRTRAAKTLTERLMGLFDRSAQPDWPWFEEELDLRQRQARARPDPQRTHATGQPAVLQRGLDALRWLAEMQTSENGHFRPIGSNGFYRRGGTRALFDQQPIEAQAMVSA